MLLAHPAVVAYDAERLEDPVPPTIISPPGPLINNSLFTVTELPEVGSILFTFNVPIGYIFLFFVFKLKDYL